MSCVVRGRCASSRCAATAISLPSGTFVRRHSCVNSSPSLAPNSNTTHLTHTSQSQSHCIATIEAYTKHCLPPTSSDALATPPLTPTLPPLRHSRRASHLSSPPSIRPAAQPHAQMPLSALTLPLDTSVPLTCHVAQTSLLSLTTAPQSKPDGVRLNNFVLGSEKIRPDRH